MASSRQLDLSSYFGLSQPQKRKIQEERCRLSYFKEYDSKRSRNFNTEWTLGRPWLVNKDEGMVCTACTESVTNGSEKGNVFIRGCTSFKLDSVIKHEKSKSHIRSMEIQNAKLKPLNESEANKLLQSLSKENFAKMDKLFRNCHALVKNNRPLLDYLWICELDEVKGLTVGETYRNINAAKLFIHFIAQVEFNKVSDFINNMPFLCLIGDGSTDSAVIEQELWFIRACFEGVVTVKFLGVYAADRADAQHIVEGIKILLKENVNVEFEYLMKKLVSLACDGASVMVGCKSGVGAILKRDQPSLVTFHCMAHRLELCLKDAAKQNKMYSKVINVLLVGIYYFYHNSPLNKSMLKRAFNAIKQGDDKLKIPTRAGGTRWISHQLNAISNLTISYKFIVAHLEQLVETSERVSSESKAKAKAFLKLLKSRSVLSFLFFLMDVLSPLSKLSLVLQDRVSVIAEHHSTLRSTLESLRKFHNSDGPNLRKVKNISEFKGVELVQDCINDACKVQFLSKIESAICERFDEFTSDGYIAATRIGNLKSWPREWEKLKDFGDDALQCILSHFSSVLEEASIDVAEAEIEWTSLKREMVESEGEMYTDWISVNKHYKQKYPNILAVFDLILSISPTSSEAERGFSQLKLIKSSQRSSMGSKLLNESMVIKTEAPEVNKFNPGKSIELWTASSLRKRRPNFQRVSLNEKDNSEEVEEIEGESNLENNVHVVQISEPPIPQMVADNMNSETDSDSESEIDHLELNEAACILELEIEHC